MWALYVLLLITGLGQSLVMPSGKLTAKSFGLTPALKKHTKIFHNIEDNKLRYQQLLHLATTCPPMKSKYKVPTNKVPGCMSTVFVHAERKDDGRISYIADADSQMAKGLVTLLVQGLTDNFPRDIEKVDPAFIDYAGIGSSLTAGRNNGFLNMLALMKLQARKLDVEPAPPKTKRKKTESPVLTEKGAETELTPPVAAPAEPPKAKRTAKTKPVKVTAKTKPVKAVKAVKAVDAVKAVKAVKAPKGCSTSAPNTNTATGGSINSADSGEEATESMSSEKTTSTPMHQSILTKLQTLQPTTLRVENVSAQHKSHPGKGLSNSRETNFNVFIVAACFEKLSLVDRHKMVYKLLQDELANGLHALSIVAKTESEV